MIPQTAAISIKAEQLLLSRREVLGTLSNTMNDN
jgi:hypothetical protein